MLERDDRHRRDSQSINHADSNMENTLSRYDEKMTKNIIMEFLKKSSLDDEKETIDYSDENEYENTDDYETADEFEDEKEYEVYSNQSLGFNDDYIPQYAASSETDNFYDEEDEEDFDIESIPIKKENIKNRSEYNSAEEIDSEFNSYKSGRRKRSTKEYDRKIKPARNSKGNLPKRDDVRAYYEKPVRDNKEQTDKESNSGVMSIIGKIAIVMVVLLVIVVIILYNKLNDVNGELSVLNANSNKVTEYESKINELENQITELNSQIEDYKKAFEDVSEQSTEETDDAAVSGNDNQDNSETEQDTQIYTVVKGDSLSKISRKTYGSESYVEQIREANNLTSDVLEIGQKLKLPEV